jgi:hypothetical protein
MPGIVKGDASSCNNPLLPFFYQEDGFLVDLHSLRFEVFFVPTGSKVHSARMSLDDCAEGGCRKALGYYVAPFDTEAVSVEVGAHEIVWYYRANGSADESVTAYTFEVLDPKAFRVSSRYVSYADSNIEALADFSVEQRQRALEAASRVVERLTGRFFFPRYMTLRHSVRPESKQLWLDQPIVGVGELAVESASVYAEQITEYVLDSSTIRIFNRHLSYLLSPDDRENPKITIVGIVDDEQPTVSLFPQGAKNVLITGAFGYTDPDGGPFGQVPQQLQEVILGLAYRQLQDPLGQDPMLQNPGRVKMAKTRDQQIAFDTSGTSGSASSSMTGDPRLDNIILGYCRPTHVGVAG